MVTQPFNVQNIVEDKMQKYHRYSLALTNDEEERFLIVKNREKIGIKKIFKAMLDVLEPPKAKNIITTEEE